MRKNPFEGKFIVVEGLDGSGNTTQADLLLKNLRQLGEKVHLTKEPTQYLIGGLIRSGLSNDWKSSPECLQLLFAADRAYHLDKEITPLLKRGISVISDRYFFSTIAYGTTEIKDQDWLIKINNKFLMPDLTFLIQARVETCLLRVKKDRFNLELFENKERLNKVWKNYLKLAKQFKNVYIVRGEEPPSDVSREILRIAKKLF